MADTSDAVVFNNPRVLTQVVRSLKIPPKWIISKWFNTVIQSTKRQVTIDLERRALRRARFTSSEGDGVEVLEKPFDTRDFTPGYIKETRPFSKAESFKRRLGEQFGAGDLTPGARSVARFVDATVDSMYAIETTKESLGAEILVTGTATLVGEGIADVTVDYKRAPQLTVVNDPTTTWTAANAATVDPGQQIIDMCTEVLLAGGGKISDVIFDATAYAAAIQSPKFLARLNKLYFTDSDVQAGPDADQEDLVSLVGKMQSLRLWVYQAYYEVADTEDENAPATQVSLIPAGYVVGVGNLLEGRVIHGAIEDEEANLMPLELFVKSWIDKRKGTRVAQVQTSLVVAPFRPNNSFSRKVL